MENFALEAAAHSAVVMIALHGGPDANGAVQRHLENYEIPFTGPNWRAAHVAGNQVGLTHFLESWNATRQSYPAWSRRDHLHNCSPLPDLCMLLES